MQIGLAVFAHVGKYLSGATAVLETHYPLTHTPAQAHPHRRTGRKFPGGLIGGPLPSTYRILESI